MKFKKLLAGILSAAMVLGTMAVPAFAGTEASESSQYTFTLSDVYCGSGDDNVSKCLSITMGFNENLNVTAEQFTAKLYSNDILLATTKRMKDTTFPTAMTVAFYYRESETSKRSWITTIENAWTQTTIPTKADFYVNNQLIGSINFDPQGVNQYQKLETAYKSLLYTADEFKAMITNAEAGSTIDLTGKTIVVDDQVVIRKNLTIKGGTFDINGITLSSGNGMIQTQADVTFDGSSFVGKDYSSCYGVLYSGTGKMTLNNCTMNLENEKSDIGAVLKSDGNGTFVIKGGNFTWKNTVRGITQATVDIDGATINATHDTKSTASFFRNVIGTVKNSNISASNFECGIKNGSDDNVPTATGTLKVLNTKFTFTGMDKDVYLKKEGCNIELDSKSTLPAASTDSVGKITDAKLADIIAAAKDGDTIDLGAEKYLINAPITINNKKITLTNGTLDISGLNNAAFVVETNGILTLSNISMTGTNYTPGWAVFIVAGKLNLINSDINLKNDGSNWGGALVNFTTDARRGSTYVENTKITLGDCARLFANTDLTMVGTDETKAVVTVTNTKDASSGKEHIFRNAFGTISGYTITSNYSETGIKADIAGNLTVVNSTITFNNATEKDIWLENGATLTIKGSTVTNANVEGGENVNHVDTDNEKSADIAEKLGISGSADSTSQVETFKVTPESTKTKVKATYTFTRGNVVKTWAAEFDIGTVETESDMTFGVYLYNIPSDVIVAGPVITQE